MKNDSSLARNLPRCTIVKARDTGFTLIEMAVTLVLTGILSVLAMPSYKNLVLNQNVRTAASELQIALMYARSEAIKRAADILVVPVANDWRSGWSVQLADATVVRGQPALHAQLSSIAGSAITYQSDGRVAAAPGSIVFKVAGNNAVTARCVTLDLSGRPVLVNDSDRDPANGCN